MTTTSNVSRLARVIGAVFAALVVTIAVSAPASATICVVPDNGGGTATLPPTGAECTTGYLSPMDVHMIIDGLPPGTTIEVGAEHNSFFGIISMPGGSLGGEKENFGSSLQLIMTGKGDLSGYSRTLQIPDVMCETHIGPRTPGAPVQSFDTDMFRLQGQIGTGDPDFDLLRVTAGTDFGLPSPGHTTLTQAPGGNWAVDSFFDITYRIDFVGAPGGPLAGHSGSTTATIRMQAGQPAVFGTCAATDIGGRTICDNESAACSPPTGGSCRTSASGCICVGSHTKAQRKCQRAIGTAYTKFAFLKMKTSEKCHDALVKGDVCNLSRADQKINLEGQKARQKVLAACTGVDLSGLTAGGCVNPDGSGPAPLSDVINCLDGDHTDMTTVLTQDQYGAFLTQCCIGGVCGLKTPKSCTASGGTDAGAGNCNPNPCT